VAGPKKHNFTCIASLISDYQLASLPMSSIMRNFNNNRDGNTHFHSVRFANHHTKYHFNTDNYLDRHNSYNHDDDKYSFEMNNSRDISDDDRLSVDLIDDLSSAKAISDFNIPLHATSSNLNESIDSNDSQLTPERRLVRQKSSSSTRSDTDSITRMMQELWGNKKQDDNFPTEETSTPLTKSIEKIVARELYEMNRDEREAIVEELHGVKSRAVTESPEKIASSLDLFQEEIILLCNSRLKDTDVNGKRHPLGKGHLRAVETLNSNYVTSPEFRIRFLRTEFFDVKKAALRYCKFLNHVWDLFGDVALVRQIALSDLNKKEIKYLKGGQVQGLLSRDKMGRRIYALFGTYDVPIRERTRVEAYLSFAAISDDETTQINGATALVFFALNDKSVVRYDRVEQRIIRKWVNCVPVRWTAMHFCMPNEPLYNFFKTIVHALIRPDMRPSTRFHTGSHMECNYALCQFGVPVDDIPKSITGTIKSKSIQKFIKARTAIEEYREERCRLLGVRYVTKALEEALVATAEGRIVSSDVLDQYKSLRGFPPACPGTDCPELDCIVFGDRVTYKHPPNVKFRDYLRDKRHYQEQLKEQERQQHGKEKRRKERIFSAEFLDEIIDDVSEILGCNFATYDKDAGWYAYIQPNTPENRQELRKKISQLMRDERKRERASITLSSGLALAQAAEAVQHSSHSENTATTISSSHHNSNHSGPIGHHNSHHSGGGAESDGSDEIRLDTAYFPVSSPMGVGAKRCKIDQTCGIEDQTCDACD